MTDVSKIMTTDSTYKVNEKLEQGWILLDVSGGVEADGGVSGINVYYTVGLPRE